MQVNFDKQARRLEAEERMPDVERPTWRYLDMQEQPAHRTHINEASRGSFVAWCRCEWVGPRCATFADADRTAVEHLNEGRHHA